MKLAITSQSLVRSLTLNQLIVNVNKSILTTTFLVRFRIFY